MGHGFLPVDGRCENLVQGAKGGTHFSDTAASRSARLLSILNRSFRAREKDRARVLPAVSFRLSSQWQVHTIAVWRWVSSPDQALRRTF
jgi:hypothetical protein